LKRAHADALAAAATAQKRIADLEEQVRTVAASRTSDLDKQKKHLAALNETIELNQKEMERLRSEAKTARAKIEQLENDNRLLQNENARLKK
jgi:septal ring factor EnvC (AmiA/AmiB activator)